MYYHHYTQLTSDTPLTSPAIPASFSHLQHVAHPLLSLDTLISHFHNCPCNPPIPHSPHYTHYQCQPTTHLQTPSQVTTSRHTTHLNTRHTIMTMHPSSHNISHYSHTPLFPTIHSLQYYTHTQHSKLQHPMRSPCIHLLFIIRGSIVASISACHAEDPGSIPGLGVLIHIHMSHALQRYLHPTTDYIPHAL